MKNPKSTGPVSELASLRSELATLRAERQQTNEEHSLLTTLLERIPDYVYCKDRQSRFLLASDAFCNLFDVSQDAIIGKTDEDLYPAEVAAETARDDLQVIQECRTLINKEERVEIGGVDHWILTTKVPWKDDSGSISGLFGISRDITERKKVEDALRESVAKNRALLEALPDLMFLLSRDGIHLDFRAPRLSQLFVRPEDFLNLSVDEVLPAEVAAKYKENIHETLDGGGLQTFEYALTFTEGDERQFEARMVESSEDEVLVIVRDTTERRRAEEDRRKLEAQLQHAQRLESLGVLAGGIAHDFNNLLTSILGGSDLALMKLPPGSSARRHVELSREGALRASDLVEQMLVYSGKSEGTLESVDLGALITDLVGLLYPSLSKKTSLQVDLAERLPAVLGNPTQIRQVLMNLVINGSEALNNAQGVVAISSGEVKLAEDALATIYPPNGLAAGRYVFVEVTDTGSGMDEATQARVFDPFFSTKVRGRGLGMSVAVGIVRGHGGSIILRSEPERGTQVRILLPCAGTPIEPKNESLALSSSWRGSGKVLVVDDEESVREAATVLLAHWGFDVLTAFDGREGVQQFREHNNEIAAVLLDVNMPELSGPEAFREIRQVRKDAPVIFSSGYSPDLDRYLANDWRVEFLQKPYTAISLMKKLWAVLEGPPASPGREAPEGSKIG